MKKTIPEFIKALSDNDFEVLEEIFLKKYRKFISVYWIIKDYADYIISLKYNKKTDSNILKISMGLTKVDVEKVLQKISKKVENKDNVLVWNEKNTIHIQITREE